MDKSTPFTHPPEGYKPPSEEQLKQEALYDQTHLMRCRDRARVALQAVADGDLDCLAECVRTLKYIIDPRS